MARQLAVVYVSGRWPLLGFEKLGKQGGKDGQILVMSTDDI